MNKLLFINILAVFVGSIFGNAIAANKVVNEKPAVTKKVYTGEWKPPLEIQKKVK